MQTLESQSVNVTPSFCKLHSLLEQVESTIAHPCNIANEEMGTPYLIFATNYSEIKLLLIFH